MIKVILSIHFILQLLINNIWLLVDKHFQFYHLILAINNKYKITGNTGPQMDAN